MGAKRSEDTVAGAPEWAGGEHRPLPPLELRTQLVDQGVIGEGGMAVIHRVYDVRLKRSLAMKVLKPDAHPSVRERFEQETLITAQLDHPAIVPVHCAGTDRDGQPSCFTMKLVEGETLAEMFSGQLTPLRGDELADFVRHMVRICDAIAFAHSRGVVHRDIKPENVMIGRFGEVYVMDWGIAVQHKRPDGALIPQADTQRGVVCGTPSYMPPEQARAADVDERSDVYAIGGVLYEALTLQPPHSGESLLQVMLAGPRDPVPPELVCPHDPPPAALSDIVMRALASDPDDRYFSVEELRLALESFLYTGDWFVRRHFEKGARVVKEGEAGDCAYLVERGTCVVCTGEGAARRELRTVGPGELFGELALFGSAVRVADVEAVTDVVLLVISRDAVDRELPPGSWTRRMVDTLGARFAEIDREHR